jgi:tetratricopeptide (TPR) repeat protein
MAERIEEAEAEAAPAGIAAGDGGAAAGIALALGRARPGARLPPEAAEFLNRQSRLVELQMEHLHEQRELVLSRLRWGRFSDRMKAAIQVMTALVGLAVVVVIAAMGWLAHEDHGVRIEAFSVPPELAQKGLTGQVVASELLDKLADLQARTVSARPASTYADDWGGDIKVEIPETGVSVGELNRYLRDWLGSETRISGEVVRTPTGLAVTARAGANAGATFEGPDAELDGLIQKAAEAIYTRTQPYRWAVYLASTGRQDEALEAYRRLARSGAPEDRAWAYAGWSEIELNRGSPARALELAQRSLAIDPGQFQARLGSANALLALGRIEETLRASLRITADLKAGRGRGVLGSEREELERTSAGAEALMHADYQSAAKLLTQERLTSEGITADERVLGAAALAADHDLAGARQALGAAGLGGAMVTLAAMEARGDSASLVIAVRPGLHEGPIDMAAGAMADAHAGRLAEARAALSGTPLDCYDCLIARGRVAALEHDWPAADRWFAEAVQQGPSIPIAQSAWGKALIDRGDPDGAISKFQDAHRIAPHFADPLAFWGEALMRKGDYAGAAAKFTEADKYAPRWGRNHMRWGEALMLSGRYAEARRQYEAANGLDLSKPDRAALNVLLARTASGPLHG